jgi:hypothetical protein
MAKKRKKVIKEMHHGFHYLGIITIVAIVAIVYIVLNTGTTKDLTGEAYGNNVRCERNIISEEDLIGTQHYSPEVFCENEGYNTVKICLKKTYLLKGPSSLVPTNPSGKFFFNNKKDLYYFTCCKIR